MVIYSNIIPLYITFKPDLRIPMGLNLHELDCIKLP